MQNNKIKFYTIIFFSAGVIITVINSLISAFGFNYDTGFFNNITFGTAFYLISVIVIFLPIVFAKKLDNITFESINAKKNNGFYIFLYAVIAFSTIGIVITRFLNNEKNAIQSKVVYLIILTGVLSFFYNILKPFANPDKISKISALSIFPALFPAFDSIYIFAEVSPLANSVVSIPYFVSFLFISYALINEGRIIAANREKDNAALIIPSMISAITAGAFYVIPQIISLFSRQVSYSEYLTLILSLSYIIYFIVRFFNIAKDIKE